MGEAQRRERRELRRPRGIAAEDRRREGEVLARGQRALHPVRMAEIMRLLADRALIVSAVEREAAGLIGRKPASALRRLVFPAPFGPVTIRAMPCALRRRRRR